MVLVWRITDDSPNSSNFLPAKLSRYTVLQCNKISMENIGKAKTGLARAIAPSL